MSAWVQELAAHATVACAVVWLMLRWIRRREAPACSGCSAAATPSTRAVRSHGLTVLR